MPVDFERHIGGFSRAGGNLRGGSGDVLQLQLDTGLRETVARLRAAGIVGTDAELVLFALRFLHAHVLGSYGDAEQMRGLLDAATSVPVVPTTSPVALAKALHLVRSNECTCRPSTGRHYAVWALLEELVEFRRANWPHVLERAQKMAQAFNREHELPLTQPPAGVGFTAAAMSQNWIRAYLTAGGAGKFRERYSKTGPDVHTTAGRGRRGTDIVLVSEPPASMAKFVDQLTMAKP